MQIKKVYAHLLLFLSIAFGKVSAQEVLTFEPQSGDMTPVVRKAIERLSQIQVKLVFKEGKYTFFPEYEYEKNKGFQKPNKK